MNIWLFVNGFCCALSFSVGFDCLRKDKIPAAYLNYFFSFINLLAIYYNLVEQGIK